MIARSDAGMVSACSGSPPSERETNCSGPDVTGSDTTLVEPTATWADTRGRPLMSAGTGASTVSVRRLG